MRIQWIYLWCRFNLPSLSNTIIFGSFNFPTMTDRESPPLCFFSAHEFCNSIILCDLVGGVGRLPTDKAKQKKVGYKDENSSGRRHIRSRLGKQSCCDACGTSNLFLLRATFLHALEQCFPLECPRVSDNSRFVIKESRLSDLWARKSQCAEVQERFSRRFMLSSVLRIDI